MAASRRCQTEEEILGCVEVGYRPVEATSAAEGVRAVCRHQPIAGAIDGIGAEAEWFIWGGQRAPAVAILGRQGAQHSSIGQIAEDVSAALAPRVLEVEQLAAVLLALEQFHGVAPRAASRSVAILSWSSSHSTKRKARSASQKDKIGTSQCVAIRSWHS